MYRWSRSPITALVLTLVLASLAWASPFPPGQVVEPLDEGRGAFNWSTGEITVDGMGLAPEHAKSAPQKKALARRAAIVDAHRRIAEVSKGFRITADTKMVDLALAPGGDVVQQRLEAWVRSGQIVKETWDPEGIYYVTMRLSAWGGGSGNNLMAAVEPQIFSPSGPAAVSPGPASGAGDPEPEPAPGGGPGAPVAYIPAPASAPPARPQAGSGPYTGLVLDCLGLDLSSCMAPKIIDTRGREIYGRMNVTPEYALSTGIAGYLHDLDRAMGDRGRVGDNPLCVKAVGKTGSKHWPTTAVVSVEDGDRILEADARGGFLKRCRVEFVIDQQFREVWESIEREKRAGKGA